MKTLLLINANVILPEVQLPKASVLIEKGRIAKISLNETLRGDDVVDLLGASLYPGFMDVHIHGAVGVDVMDASAGDLQTISEFLATQGVTSWLPTLVPAPDHNYLSAVTAISELMQGGDSTGARAVGLHYEGPFVNSLQCGALRSNYFKTYSTSTDLDLLPTPRAEAVKMITVAPEIAGGVDLVRELTARGWIVSIGHTRADVKVLDEAVAAGARHMTHFMNAMAPMHHRKPGPIDWGLSRDDVGCDVIADGIHVDPFMLKLLMKIKGSSGLNLISDAIAAAGKGDGEYRIWGETIMVKDGRTSNAAGTIAGSVITMLDAVRLMLSLGATPVELAQMASLNPAGLLGLDRECGSIEEGKRADLVALDGDGNVKLTIVGGRVVFQAK